MPALIKQTRNGTIVEFDKGSFDEWCVYITAPGQSRYAPKDIEYFDKLRQLGAIYGHARIYNDFIRIYSVMSKQVNDVVLSLINTIAAGYAKHADEIEVLFTIIYAGMIAEENKAKAILGKRIKRLGMQQVLLENNSAEYAANFSKGKRWKELDAIMKAKGF